MRPSICTNDRAHRTRYLAFLASICWFHKDLPIGVNSRGAQRARTVASCARLCFLSLHARVFASAEHTSRRHRPTQRGHRGPLSLRAEPRRGPPPSPAALPTPALTAGRSAPLPPRAQRPRQAQPPQHVRREAERGFRRPLLPPLLRRRGPRGRLVPLRRRPPRRGPPGLPHGPPPPRRQARPRGRLLGAPPGPHRGLRAEPVLAGHLPRVGGPHRPGAEDDREGRRRPRAPAGDPRSRGAASRQSGGTARETPQPAA